MLDNNQEVKIKQWLQESVNMLNNALSLFNQEAKIVEKKAIDKPKSPAKKFDKHYAKNLTLDDAKNAWRSIIGTVPKGTLAELVKPYHISGKPSMLSVNNFGNFINDISQVSQKQKIMLDLQRSLSSEIIESALNVYNIDKLNELPISKYDEFISLLEENING